MYKLLKKYNRKLLAFFTILLMIVFVITSGPNRSTGNGDREDLVIGTIGNEKVRVRDLDRAKQQWELLRSVVVTQSPVPTSATESRRMSILEVLTQPRQGQFTMFPISAAKDISEKPELFMLLLKEADRMAIFAGDEDVRNVFANQFAVRQADKIVPLENVTDPQLQQAAAQAVGSLLRVVKTFQAAAGAVKISAPMREFDLARSRQQMAIQLVELQTKDFVAQLAAPTPEQLQAHFEKYADTAPGNITPGSPFGFGYKFPDRVEFQAISLAKADLRKLVRGSKSDYDWEVEARRYYQKHPTEFATTQPTSKPSDAFSLGGGSSSPSTAPTTRPFDEVKDSLIDQVVNPLVQPLQVKIQAFITDKLAADYASYAAANPTTAPAATTAPFSTTAATSPASLPSDVATPYASYEYLQKLAGEVQTKFGILPSTVSYADKMRSADELSKIPGIGESRVGFISFANYATQKIQELFPGYPPQVPPKLLALQPSQPMIDSADTTYIFRLTAVDPSHKARDMRDSMAAVQDDFQKLAVLELTRAAAEKLRAAAIESSLPAAAGQRPVISTGDFDLESTEVPNYAVSSTARRDFLQNAFNLLSLVSATRPSASVGLIEMPSEGKVIVAEVLDVKPKWTGPRYLAEATVGQQLMRQLVEQNMQASWYAYDNVVARLGFAAESRGKKDQG